MLHCWVCHLGEWPCLPLRWFSGVLIPSNPAHFVPITPNALGLSSAKPQVPVTWVSAGARTLPPSQCVPVLSDSFSESPSDHNCH